jgi:peptidoglycan L-alanyl-D-glutamate endopeptidase CwlK
MNIEQVKARNKERLATLLPAVRAAAEDALEQALDEGIVMLVTCGERTLDEQAKLYAKGRTIPGPKVTNAKPGQSIHNYKMAFDVVLIKSGEASWEVDKQWKRFAEIAKKYGFKWGGEFKTLYDPPHFEMAWGLTWRDLANGKKPPKQAYQYVRKYKIDEKSVDQNKEENALTKEQANAAIKHLQDMYKLAKTEEEKRLIGIIADSFRVASGQKVVNN